MHRSEPESASGVSSSIIASVERLQRLRINDARELFRIQIILVDAVVRSDDQIISPRAHACDHLRHAVISD